MSPRVNPELLATAGSESPGRMVWGRMTGTKLAVALMAAMTFVSLTCKIVFVTFSMALTAGELVSSAKTGRATFFLRLRRHFG